MIVIGALSIGWGFANHFRLKVHVKDANEFEKKKIFHIFVRHFSLPM